MDFTPNNTKSTRDNKSFLVFPVTTPVKNMIGVILMTTQNNNFRAPESHKTVFSVSPVYKV